MALLEKHTWTRANTWYLWVACFQWHTKHLPQTQEDHFILIYEERQTSPHIFDRSNTTWEFMILSKHSILQLLWLAEMQGKSSWGTTCVIRIYCVCMCIICQVYPHGDEKNYVVISKLVFRGKFLFLSGKNIFLPYRNPRPQANPRHKNITASHQKRIDFEDPNPCH